MQISAEEMFNNVVSIFELVVGMVVFIMRRGDRAIRLTLALSLFIWSAAILLGILNYSGKIRYLPFLIRVDSPIHFLLGPALYFYTLSSLNKHFKFRKYHLLHFLPFLINVIQFLPFYLSSSTEKLNYYNDFMGHGSIIISQLYLIKTIHFWIYFLTELYIFYRQMLTRSERTQDERYLMTWFVIFLSFQCIIYSTFSIDHIRGLIKGKSVFSKFLFFR